MFNLFNTIFSSYTVVLCISNNAHYVLTLSLASSNILPAFSLNKAGIPSTTATEIASETMFILKRPHLVQKYNQSFDKSFLFKAPVSHRQNNFNITQSSHQLIK